MLETRFHQQLMINNKWTYENMSNLTISDSILKEIRYLLPLKDWETNRNGVWQYFKPKNQQIILQGWKIHVSSTYSDLIDIAQIVTRCLVEHRISFKILADHKSYSFINSKLQGRGSSGKFITIYPDNETEFKNIIEVLYILLQGKNGPYILSDNRYRDSKCVYYRYGAITAQVEKTFDGFDQYVIKDHEGMSVIDARDPFYKVPSWIIDPFSNEDWNIHNTENNDGEDNLLNNRYEILEALQFSSTGGVYLAYDIQNHQRVVIKEARPYTSLTKHSLDSIDRLKNEEEFIKEFSTTMNIPKYIDSFIEWEHQFLVISFIQGVTLSEFVNQNHQFMNLESKMDFNKYLIKLKEIWLSVGDQINTVHSKGWYMSDLSSNNIIISEQINGDIKVHLIDFEGSFSNNNKDSLLSTYGFTPQNSNLSPIFKDIYAYCSIILSTIYPLNGIQGIASKNEYKNLYNFLFDKIGVNQKINELFDDVIFERFINFDSISKVSYFINNLEIKRTEQTPVNRNQDKVAYIYEIKSKLLSSLTNNLNYSNNSRVIPADPTVFFTNKIGIAYGATGILHTLNYLNENIPEELLGWIMDKDFSNINNGLFNGLSGLGWVLCDLHYIQMASYILEEVYTDSNNDDVTIENGLSGIGLTALKLYKESNEDKFLDMIFEIEKKIDQIININDFSGVETFRGEKYYGFFKGTVGVAYFYINLSKELKDEKYLRSAKIILDYVLENVMSFETYDTVLRNDILNTSNKVASPYLSDGTSGLIKVLLAYWELTKDEQIYNRIKKLINDLNRPITPFPSLLMGMSGIVDSLLDTAISFETIKFDELIMDYITAIEKYIVKNPDNGESCMPGAQLFRVSFDYATGSAGVICVLHRAQKYFEGENIKSPLFTI